MKYGYLTVALEKQPPPKPKWYEKLVCCVRNTPYMNESRIGNITIEYDNKYYNLDFCLYSETIIIPYIRRWSSTSFPKRIMFNDTCMILEHFDPYTHNNCDPIMTQILGEHPEFQVCLYSPNNGSYIHTTHTNNQVYPVFSICKVKSNSGFTKYIYGYDDKMLPRENVFAIIKLIFGNTSPTNI